MEVQVFGTCKLAVLEVQRRAQKLPFVRHLILTNLGVTFGLAVTYPKRFNPSKDLRFTFESCLQHDFDCRWALWFAIQATAETWLVYHGA